MLQNILSSKLTTHLHAHLLALLERCTAINHLKQIHSLLVTSGGSKDASCNPKILKIAAVSIPGDAAYASLLFRQTRSRLPSLWNAVLRCYSLQSHHEEAISHYIEMLREGVVPDKHTYPLLLKVVSRSGSIDTNQVHAQISKCGFRHDPFVQNSLVAAYAKCGDLASARKLFDVILSRDPVSWTAMIHGYVENGQAFDGLALFGKMRFLGVEVDEVVTVSALKCVGMLGDVWLGRCIHGFYVECGRVKWDVFVGSALVDMYSKCGYCGDARKVFEEMPRRNVVTWSGMIAGYVQCSRYKDALSFFQGMLVEGLRPNQVTLASTLTACAQMGALDQGRWIHHYAKKNNLELNSVVDTALVDMYAKCGCIDDALTIFKRMQQKDVYPWTALINGFAMHGYASECLDFFSRMTKEEVQPNEVTFIGVLSACSHGGLVDKGWHFFNSMSKDYGIKPKMEHYGCMVDLLGRAGRLEEALHLIESIPMEASDGIWGALLNACMIHRDVELGERIAKHLVNMLPHSSSSSRYTLLANIYSLSHKWDDAANMRMAMKGVKVEKIRGCSWVEVNGVVHEFVAFDESHPRSQEIYHTLDGMDMIMRLKKVCS